MRKVSIKDIAKIHYGKALKKDERVESGEVNVFGSNGVVGNHDDFLFQEPTVIIGRKGSVGKTIYTEEKSWTIDTAFFSEIDKEKVDIKYFYYALTAKDMEQYAITTSIPGINRNDIYDLKIPLPTLSEQKAIVAKLDRAQRVIDIDREMLAKYDELIQSAFLEMFGDVALNPKNWKRKPIKDLLVTKKIKRENPKKTKKIYDYISISDVDNELKRIVGHTAIDKTDAPSRARQLLKPNDVLVSTVRPNLNAVALYKSGLSNPIASTGFCVIRPDIEIINPHYLFQISKSRYFVSELSLIANGASYPAVTDQDILNLEIPLPPLNEQNRFEEIIEKISQEYRVTQANQKKSEELFSSLVRGVFG